MFNNPFKPRARKLPPFFDVSAATAEGERRLEEAKKNLDALQEKYYSGEYEGYADDMWEMMSDYESMVETLSVAKKRGWVPSKKVIKGIRTDLEKQKRWMVKNSYSQTAIDSEVEWRQQYLADALQGLR